MRLSGVDYIVTTALIAGYSVAAGAGIAALLLGC